jgi:ribose 5-phosphate isomerase B
VLAIGAFFTAPRLASAMADAFLEHLLGDGYESWEGFHGYHNIGYSECETFDYETYKANGFSVVDPQEAHLGPEPLGLAY